MMQPGERRSSSAVAAGSVWETRMKMDEVRGGIKVFNAEDETNADDPEGIRVFRRLRMNHSDGGGVIERKKRRNWRPPEPVADNKNPILLMKARSELLSSDEDEIEIETEGEAKSFDDKEIDLPPPPTTTEEKILEVEEDEEEKIQQIREVSVSSPPLEIDLAMDLKKIERIETHSLKTQPSKIYLISYLFW